MQHRLIFIIIFSFFLVQGQSQSVSELVAFADQKFEQGQYHLAAKEYQRALYFGKKEQVAVLNVATGDCYFELGEYENAEKYYRFASTIIHNDSLKAKALLKKSSCNILMQQYQLALFDLFNLRIDGIATLEKEKSILIGISYYGLEDFAHSEEYFLKAIDLDPSADKALVQSLFDDKKLMRPNPKLAYWMSVVIPGSGQFYSGDFKNGINSFVLSFGLSYFTYRMAFTNSILDAILTVFPWWQRYYIGGYNSAERIALAKRAKNRSHIYHKIYDEVMK